MEELRSLIYSAEDDIFTGFCRKIGVANIREYEERQLKVAQEESEARLRFDTQIQRLTHQFVLSSSECYSSFLTICPNRFEFKEEQLKNIQGRLATLETTVKAERTNLERLKHQKQTVQEEITDAGNAIAEQQEELKLLKSTLDEKTNEVEKVKKTTSQASKVLDQALKVIESMVRRVMFGLVEQYLTICIRTPKSRNLPWSVLRYIGNVVWRR
jgi:structural maintenance of chromosome 1